MVCVYKEDPISVFAWGGYRGRRSDSYDDLDLQIIWLTAVERFGRQVDASVLAEYWLSYVIPNWAEYGIGKSNLTAGLVPPLSGFAGNQYANPCGCLIRSEIWVYLAPGAFGFVGVKVSAGQAEDNEIAWPS